VQSVTTIQAAPVPLQAGGQFRVGRSSGYRLRQNYNVEATQLTAVFAKTFTGNAPDTISANRCWDAFFGNSEPQPCCI